MFADFLPPSVVDIQDLEAIALLQQIQRQVVQVAFEQGTTAIATAYVRHAPVQSASLSNASPNSVTPRI